MFYHSLRCIRNGLRVSCGDYFGHPEDVSGQYIPEKCQTNQSLLYSAKTQKTTIILMADSCLKI
jgi:hypothetical protein